MKKREINVADHACEILKALKTGVLLTSCADGRVNTMTISWGMLGIEWNYPLFITVVREGRFTRSLLDKNGQFTINIPRADSPITALAVCGTKSGRDIDKIAQLGLTLVDGEEVSVPAIKEFPLTLECQVVYKQLQNLDALEDRTAYEKCYPQDISGTSSGSNRDAHIAYYGKILRAYMIEE